LWKVFDETAKAPEFLERKYRYEPIRGKVVVDLFWNTFCQTSVIEARRVREVAAEFGEHVVLHEYPADDHEILLRLQTPRGIFVNRKEIWWGYEAPKEGIREAISQALEENG
jgi:thiol-disulfide isomerase/thioredoxin